MDLARRHAGGAQAAVGAVTASLLHCACGQRQPMVAIECGDLLDVLPMLAPDSMHCVVTSPPYWGLRDYGVKGRTWADGWTGALGLEPDPVRYVRHLVECFAAIRRVLRPDGVAWLVIGDCYSDNGRGGDTGSTLQGGHRGQGESRRVKVRELARNGSSAGAKQLLMIPARVALALQDDGWYLRAEIVWQKPNPMPESVRDRPTRSHETVYLLSRSRRYFYDWLAIAEPCRSAYVDVRKMAEQKDRIGAKHLKAGAADERHKASSLTNIGKKRGVGVPGERNARSVWTIPTVPYRGAHFATFPPALAARCIRAGTSEGGVCASCGAQAERITERQAADGRGSGILERKLAGGRNAQGQLGDEKWHGDGLNTHMGSSIPWNPLRTVTTGWRLPCGHEADRLPALVLDPFGGSGTTAQAALALHRSAISVDVNPAYEALARRRVGQQITAALL